MNEAAIKDCYQTIQANMQAAAAEVGRAEQDVQLLAVSKGQSVEKLRCLSALGQRCFAENYLQEAEAKIMQLPPSLEWHFIGPIQSNKTRKIVELFHWVHGIEREKIATRLNRHCEEMDKYLEVCIQVNIDREATKSGVFPGEVMVLAQAIHALPHLRLRGLMAIPSKTAAPEAQRAAFRSMQTLKTRLQAQGMMLDTLSMGMSGDYELAIAEGATIVRVGTALFGERQYNRK